MADLTPGGRSDWCDLANAETAAQLSHLRCDNGAGSLFDAFVVSVVSRPRGGRVDGHTRHGKQQLAPHPCSALPVFSKSLAAAT
jgi:hypothetical protein